MGFLQGFYATVKESIGHLMIKKIFITGVSPVDLTSGFNVEKDVSFRDTLSGLCGLNRDDVKAALRILPEVDSVDEGLSHLTAFVDGYHFCYCNKVEPVFFNTTTCLGYLQVSDNCLVQNDINCVYELLTTAWGMIESPGEATLYVAQPPPTQK